MVAVVLLYNICTHAVPFTRKSFRLNMQIFFTDARFVYTKTVKTPKKMHGNVFTSKTLLLKSLSYRVNTMKTWVKTTQSLSFFPETFLCERHPSVNNWKCAVSKRGEVIIGNRMWWVQSLNGGQLVLKGRFLIEEYSTVNQAISVVKIFLWFPKTAKIKHKILSTH